MSGVACGRLLLRSRAVRLPAAQTVRSFQSTAVCMRTPMIAFRYGGGREKAAVAEEPAIEYIPPPPAPGAPAGKELEYFGAASVARKNATPHIYMDKTVVVDDMLEVLDYLKRNGQPGACITDMLMRAAQSALEEVPAANSVWSDAANQRLPLSEPCVALTLRDRHGVVSTSGGNSSATINALSQWRASTVTQLAGGAGDGAGATGLPAVSVVHAADGDGIDADVFRTVVGNNHPTVISFGSLNSRVGVAEMIVDEETEEETGEVVPCVETVLTVSLSSDGRVLDGYLAGEYLSAVCNNLSAGKLLQV